MQNEGQITKKFNLSNNSIRMLAIILSLALLAGVGTGYKLASNNTQSNVPTSKESQITKSAQKDTRTFRDFAEGTIQTKPAPKNGDEYSEGTHNLIRQNAVPVALTSSVVDLSLYEGKKVKVYGETQKAIKEGWLMDVGKVEETN